MASRQALTSDWANATHSGRTAGSNRAFWLGRFDVSHALGRGESLGEAAPLSAPLSAPEYGTLAALGLSIRNVVALDADDHYTRVYLREGSRYLRAQFGHLLQQMPDDLGIQISRSRWVAFKAIEKVVRSGRGLSVRLVTGQQMQVTRGYKVAFESAQRRLP